nr:HAMP domain-containing sensor histidine kinase [Sinirhodobacter sp. WL0062]
MDAALARNLTGAPAIGSRFDLLASRLDLLGEGPQARYLEDLGLADALTAQSAAVLAFDPHASVLTGERIGQLSDALTALRQSLHKAANRAMVAEWEELSLRLESYRGAVEQVILSLVLGLAVASFLGWRLVRDQRNLLRAEEVRLRSVRLEQELQQERAPGAYWRDFAAVVSHQLRTPLAVIDSSAQRILRRQGAITPDEQAQRLETIRSTVFDLSRLVDAALLSGQIDNEIRSADCARHDLVAPSRLLLRDLEVRHPDRALRIEAAEVPLRAWCDTGLVVHIVMNLLEDALRHSSGAVDLRLFKRGERVGCAVVDQGPGGRRRGTAAYFRAFPERLQLRRR